MCYVWPLRHIQGSLKIIVLSTFKYFLINFSEGTLWSMVNGALEWESLGLSSSCNSGRVNHITLANIFAQLYE